MSNLLPSREDLASLPTGFFNSHNHNRKRPRLAQSTARGRGRGRGGRSTTPSGSYVCRICNTPGHFIQDCPQALAATPGKRESGRGSSGNRSHSSHRNHHHHHHPQHQHHQQQQRHQPRGSRGGGQQHGHGARSRGDPAFMASFIEDPWAPLLVAFRSPQPPPPPPPPGFDGGAQRLPGFRHLPPGGPVPGFAAGQLPLNRRTTTPCLPARPPPPPPPHDGHHQGRASQSQPQHTAVLSSVQQRASRGRGRSTTVPAWKVKMDAVAAAATVAATNNNTDELAGPHSAAVQKTAPSLSSPPAPVFVETDASGVVGAEATTTGLLAAGAQVTVQGLKSSGGQLLNGSHGRIELYDSGSGRYIVHLDAGLGIKKFKPVNVVPVIATTAALGHSSLGEEID